MGVLLLITVDWRLVSTTECLTVRVVSVLVLVISLCLICWHSVCVYVEIKMFVLEKCIPEVVT